MFLLLFSQHFAAPFSEPNTLRFRQRKFIGCGCFQLQSSIFEPALRDTSFCALQMDSNRSAPGDGKIVERCFPATDFCVVRSDTTIAISSVPQTRACRARVKIMRDHQVALQMYKPNNNLLSDHKSSTAQGGQRWTNPKKFTCIGSLEQRNTCASVLSS